MKMIRTDTQHPDFVELIQGLDAELQGHYGAVQATYDEHNQMGCLQTAMLGYVDDLPVTCGCFRIVDEESVEIKRMFVRKAFRRKGHANVILQSRRHGPRN